MKIKVQVERLHKDYLFRSLNSISIVSGQCLLLSSVSNIGSKLSNFYPKDATKRPIYDSLQEFRSLHSLVTNNFLQNLTENPWNFIQADSYDTSKSKTSI